MRIQTLGRALRRAVLLSDGKTRHQRSLLLPLVAIKGKRKYLAGEKKNYRLRPEIGWGSR